MGANSFNSQKFMLWYLEQGLPKFFDCVLVSKRVKISWGLTVIENVVLQDTLSHLWKQYSTFLQSIQENSSTKSSVLFYTVIISISWTIKLMFHTGHRFCCTDYKNLPQNCNVQVEIIVLCVFHLTCILKPGNSITTF